MPYAAKAKIEHEFDTDHLNVWLTFRHPMDQNLKPPLALWLLEADDVSIDIVDSDWQDEWTLLLTSDALGVYPERVLLEYNGPNSNLQTTWGKDWEPWGPILSTDIGRLENYVNRGDPAGPDFSGVQLVSDGAYHELDLSAIVPEGVSAVHLALKIIHSAVGVGFRIRQAGNVNEYNVSTLFMQVAWAPRYHDPFVKVGADRKIEYKLSNVAWVTKELTVRGWIP